MSDRETFLDKLTKQAVYLKYGFEDCVLRSEPGKGFWVKFKGEEEFKAEDESAIVTEAILNPEEITKSEYEAY